MTVGLAHARSAVVGVVSDTHGRVRREALAALEGVDLVVHAGDVGKAEVLEALARIAPVVAVRGNADADELAKQLPVTADIEVAGVWIHVLHKIDDLRVDPRRAGFGVVIHGHSHRPRWEWRDGVLFINPGSIGPRRFSLPVSLARLRVAGGRPSVESIHVDLAEAP